MNPVSENIFQAIDQLVDAKLNTIAFDKTDLCEVLLVYNDIPNTYRVSNGSMKFDAIGQPDAKYIKGQNVYVLIPKGDYTANKIIIGEYSAEEEKKYQYISPLDRLIAGWRGSWQANGPNEYLTIQVTAGKTEHPTESVQQLIRFDNHIPLNGFGKYTYMGFELGLGCQFEYLQGSYSIDVQLREEDNTEPLYTFSILSTEIQGNPYSLSYQMPISYITTSNIEDINKIKCVTFNLRQNDDFAEGDIGKTIALTSFHIMFGYEKEKLLSEFNDGALKVVLDTPFNPDNRQEDYVYDSDSEKILSLDWLFDKELYNEYLPLGSEQYTIYWCQYVKGYQKDLDNLDIEESGIYWKTIQRSNSATNEAYTLNFTPNSNWDEDQLKVVICKEVNSTRQIVVTSEGITFKNKNLQAPQGTNTAVDNELELRLADNDDGNYNIYGTDNRLTSYAKKNMTTSVTVHNYFDNTDWNDTEVVTWKIPINATMLKPDNNWKNEDDEYNITGDKQYYIISGNNLRTITYDFADIYSSTRSHNTVYCEVYRADKQKTYRGSIDLRFGQANTNGSGYSLNIVPLNGSNGALPYAPQAPYSKIEFQAILEDESGHNIAIPQDKIIWSWHYHNTINSDVLQVNAQDPTKCTIVRIDSLLPRAANLVLRAEIKGFQTTSGTLKLMALYPISKGANNYIILGSTRIMYDHTGRLASYDRTPYQLLIKHNDGSLSQADYTNIKLLDSNDADLAGNNTGYYPSLSENGALIPMPQFPPSVKPCCISFYNKDGICVWYSPIIIEQDTYASALLNEWDGNLIVDSKGNKILAQSIGAGIKNSDNEYTGVLMGKVELDGSTSPTGLPTTNYGLYGFNNGELRFSFDEEGNGYLAGTITATGNSKFGNSGYQLYIGTVNDGQNLALLMGNETNNLEFWLSASKNNMISYTNSLKFTPQFTNIPAITFGTAGLITINNSLIVEGMATFESGMTCTKIATFQHDLVIASDYSLYNPGKYVFGFDWDLRDGVMGINSDSSIYINAIKSGQLQGTWTLNGASISTSSDQNAKYDILDLSNKYESLFDALQPRLYKFKNGTSNRFHTGFIAQEVNDALMDAGLDTMDFAAVVIENPETEEERWGLRYEEFISVNTWQIQKLKSQVTELEDLLREKGVI